MPQLPDLHNFRVGNLAIKQFREFTGVTKPDLHCANRIRLMVSDGEEVEPTGRFGTALHGAIYVRHGKMVVCVHGDTIPSVLNNWPHGWKVKV